MSTEKAETSTKKSCKKELKSCKKANGNSKKITVGFLINLCKFLKSNYSSVTVIMTVSS